MTPDNINLGHVDIMHHVTGLHKLHDETEGQKKKQPKQKKDKRHKLEELDEILEEELDQAMHEETSDDENPDHIDFCA
jgi:hypothetical protein